LSVRADQLQSLIPIDTKEVRSSGPIVIKAKIKGNFDQLTMDTEADLRKASLSWRPKFISSLVNVEKVAVRVRVASIGSKNTRFEGAGELSLNFKHLSPNTSKENSELRIEGSAPVAAKFTGNPSNVNWSLKTDLEHLHLSTANGFRKPDGAKANVEAAGTWSQTGLNIVASLLCAPGLRIKTTGMLIDRNSRFGKLDLRMETEDVASILSYDPAFSRLGISGALKASMLIRRAEYGNSYSGRIHLASVNCVPEKALWGLKNMTGTLEFNGQTINIRDLGGKAAGYVEAPFRLTGTLRDIGSPQSLTGNISLKVAQGKVTSDRIVKILTQAHSLIGNMIKPRPVSMKGVFIEFDEARADIVIKSGRATTGAFLMKGQEIRAAAVGSLEIGSLELGATLGITTNVVGSDTLETVPILGELMQRHRDSLLKIPVTVFARLSGPLLSGLNVMPLQNSDMNKPILDKLEALMKERN